MIGLLQALSNRHRFQQGSVQLKVRTKSHTIGQDQLVNGSQIESFQKACLKGIAADCQRIIFEVQFPCIPIFRGITDAFKRGQFTESGQIGQIVSRTGCQTVGYPLKIRDSIVDDDMLYF